VQIGYGPSKKYANTHGRNLVYFLQGHPIGACSVAQGSEKTED
jgi:hypothetical protein